MAAFHYIAVSKAGQNRKGVIEAENEKQARQLLRDQSLIPVKVQATQEKKKKSFFANFSFS